MTAFGWNGADPVEQDAGSGAIYELGTRFRAQADVTITHARVWHGTHSATVTGRQARVWSASGVLQESVAIPAALSSGWTLYAFSQPLGVPAGTDIWISYDTVEYYGATIDGLAAPVNSADGLVTAESQAFATSAGTFPTQVFGDHFYGVDIGYIPGLPGTGPLTAALGVTMNNLVATATLSADRPATYVVEWGDGSKTQTSSSTATHTYAYPGAYAVMLTATDNAGITDSAAAVAVAVAAQTFTSGTTGIGFHRETATIINADIVSDRHGDQVRDWTHTTELTVTGVRVVPLAAPEFTSERDEVIRHWLLFAPPDTPLYATSRVRYLDDVFEVDGQPRLWASASGRLAHLEADLIRVEG